MSVITILIIFLIAIVLLFVEMFLIPGFGIAGISSLALVLSGIIMTYKNYGILVGNIALIGSIVFLIIFVVFALKQKTWKLFALKTDIDSKAPNIEDLNVLNIGDTGFAKTRLGPIGEIEVNELIYEASSKSEFIDAGSEIEIIQLTNNSITVKSKNK